MTTARRVLYDDLMALQNDEYQHELVRGEILCMPPPKGDHGGIEMALAEAIGRYLYERARTRGWDESRGRATRHRLVGYLGGGEQGIRFSLPDDPDQVRGLDVLYLSAEQVARFEEQLGTEYIPGVPALVAEVISPSESADDVNQKVTDLLSGGARLVWLIYRTTHTVHIDRADGTLARITADGTLDGEDVLPGFSLTLANLFA